MIRSLFYLAAALAALLYLTAHVGQAMPSSADICPPAATTQSSAECLPCTPERCSAPSSPRPAPCVVVSISRGDDYLEAVGRLTYRQSGAGFDYVELDGRPGEPETGPVRVSTIRPPIELRPAPGRCGR